MKKIVKAIIVGALILLSALLGAVGHSMVAKPVEVTVPGPVEYVNVSVPGPVQVVEKVVTVNSTVEVPVEDTAFLSLVCDRLMYEDLMECKEEVAAENKALLVALAEVKAKLGDELEDANIVDDENEVDLIKVYSKYEDITVVDSDFDDESYEFEIKVKVDDEDADEKKTVIFTVEVQDGEAEITSVDEE